MEGLFWLPGHEILLRDVVRAENCDLHAADGRRFVDLESGIWCTSIGHSNPHVLQVIREQSARITHTGYNYTCGIVNEAANAILGLLDLTHGACVFLCSGSEAVEYGVRVTRMVLERPLLMTMTDSYFGAYGSASERSEDAWYGFDWSACADCPANQKCDDTCEHWRDIPFDRIGGFLFEPGSSSGWVRFPPEKLIASITKTIRDSDGFLLVNEVTTGVGRTGRWFGHQHYSIQPDVVAMGKGIGNGYPVSVAAFSRRMVDRLGDRPVRYAQSHQNDPLGAAIVREVVRVIEEEGLIERCREIGRILLDGLTRIAAGEARIAAVRGRGLMIAIELRDDPDATLTNRIHQGLFRRGFLICRRPGLNVLRIDPALTIEKGTIEQFLRVFEEVLREA